LKHYEIICSEKSILWHSREEKNFCLPSNQLNVCRWDLCDLWDMRRVPKPSKHHFLPFRKTTASEMNGIG
jgi:hypothetical protein